MSKKQDVDKYAPYLFISPFYILFLIFGLFPIIFAGILAFHKWDGLGEMRFVGWGNFIRLLHDTDFYLSVKNTLIIWVVGTFPMLFLALVLAFMLNLKFVKHKEWLKAIFFLPNVTSVVAVTILFGLIFSNLDGLANSLLQFLGLSPIKWVTSTFWVRIVIALINIWMYLGYNTIIYLTGITKIPKDYYEAAIMDGATNFQIFRYITIPQLKPIILFTVMMSTIGGLQVFSEAQVLVPQGATPEGGAMTIVYYLYHAAFSNNDYGYGSALAWALVIIIMIFSLLNWYLTTYRIKGE
ncbi:carbohydrate ABC transporter permease [Streptococcus acidominimus]|uniref:Sugar ABC transporter permease n=1 Tax=Streptococcus acidominimus TaxID=1326 RepID=A0A4Y9FRF7_STRAI|nr:sugar ABC transporter permease [Streptococcus acidominimus]MBF0818691.1 sugar ABC transporter permease [Streptococcus acidominimus]MBF0838366.1 sugar ABC transporter permease [Streptococcus acidominimus]MBF0847318.1 sugar ABC transporter permease [Streptococcus danieliae]TFU30859.1 sugar ABC transporter permease [Streptococcus acidominimus]